MSMVVAESIFAKSFLLDAWQSSEYASDLSVFVLTLFGGTYILTGKCQIEIKSFFRQISMETNQADKRTSQFEFLRCGWSI